MDKEWVNARIEAEEREIKNLIEHVKSEIRNQELLPESSKEKYLVLVDEMIQNCYKSLHLTDMYLDAEVFDIPEEEWTKEQADTAERIQAWNIDLNHAIHKISNYYMYINTFPSMDDMNPRSICHKYADSDIVHFEGDIIITDPCYIMAEDDDWSKCEYGDRLDILGLKTFMTRGTIYGDWSCTTYNVDTKEPIGEFCADAGLVSVMLLDEVLQYNPKFDYHKDRTWTTTWIKNFKGDVQFIVIRTEGVYQETTEYHKAGETWENFEVQVHGHGFDSVTGEPINFITSQTGL